MGAGRLAQPVRRGRVEVEHECAGQVAGARPIGPSPPGEQGRCLDPGQCGAPDVQGRVPVLLCQPGEIGPVGGYARQGAVVAVVCVQLEEFAYEQGHRPAVEQDVMAGHDEPVAVRSGAHQGETHQRRGGEVEPAGAVRGEERGEAVLHRPRGARTGQVQLLQRHRHLGRDGLHGLVQVLVEEPDPQVGVPPQQTADGGPQGGDVDGAFEFEDELCGVDVHGAGVVQRVEQHARL